MTAQQPVEEAIDRRLRSLGLAGFGASILEALAPLAPVGAQFAYILEPMVSNQPRSWLTEVAELLEQPRAVEAFARRLREDPR